MGAYFQVIVDKDVSDNQANIVSEKTLMWLIERGVIASTPTACILGIDKLGYPPGPNYRDVVENYEEDDYLLKLKVNGLQVDTTRRVFPIYEGKFKVSCPQCDAAYNPDKSWDDAVNEWYEGKGNGILHCRKCQNTLSVTEWVYEPTWGFGSLGFTFWNWPPLKKSFIKEFYNILGHRTVLVAGKL